MLQWPPQGSGTGKEAGGRNRDSKRALSWLGRREDDALFVSSANARAANMIVDVNDIKMQRSYQQPTIESNHVDMSTDRHINFTNCVVELVKDGAVESTTSYVDFCPQDEIMRITDDLVKHPNAPSVVEIKLKPHDPHIKFVDVSNDNKFSLMIFVDLVA
ncbi:uncharacterized protein HKW66_Vig0208870 [Vigna angularis]|uniref:Uncharacterized protein n=1 Tax=Phaseolus angularis TaxID=3914 RepID=A0A8T0JIZ1_PHAAN|nr:uncharacterized protein HKW66_Vig0208870 [Vigna angularis]